MIGYLYLYANVIPIVKVAIKNLSNVRAGLFAKPSPGGSVAYLQAKDFDELGNYNAAIRPDLIELDGSNKHLLKDGEVLFAAKGSKNFAAVFQQLRQPAVASTSFLVISPLHSGILPAYIAWFLNHPSSQALLKGQAKGSGIPSITKQDLEQLEILVPSIEVQKAVVELGELLQKEKSLRQQIETLREKQIQQHIINAIK